MKNIVSSSRPSAVPSDPDLYDAVADGRSDRAAAPAHPAWEGLPSRRCTTEWKAATTLQAAARGSQVRRQVRRQVRIAGQGPGVVSTAIRAPGDPLSSSVAPGTFVADIQQHLQPAATFTQVSVRNGTFAVHGTHDGEAPRDPREPAHGAAPGAAFINGGFFVHKTGLQTDGGETIESLGRPVGQVVGRQDFIPVPGPWVSDYAAITVDGELVLHGGPLLALDGKPIPLEDSDSGRLHYRIDGRDNPLNRLAGSLTHSGDANERSAVSLVPGRVAAAPQVLLQTVTAGGNRKAGVTMAQWQTITALAAHSVADAALPGHADAGTSTLNLDGGGSVFLGIRHTDGVKMMARGGSPDHPVRPVSNVVASASGGAGAAMAMRPYRPEDVGP